MIIQQFIDIDQKKLVFSSTSSEPATLPAFYFQDDVTLQITLLSRKATGGFRDRYTVVDIDDLSLRVGLGARHGNQGGDPIVLQTSWTKDLTNNRFEGVLSLNTLEVQGQLEASGDGEITVFYEVTVLENGQHTTVLHESARIREDVIRTDAADPTVTQDVSAFADALATDLTNTDTITWTQDGDDILAEVNLDPAGGLTSGASGVAANFGIVAETVAEGDTVHDPVTIVSDTIIDEVPVMTDYTSGAVTISASHDDTGTEAWKAFDDTEGTQWETPTLDESLGQDETWLAVDFGADQVIQGYELTDAARTTASGITTLFQGSDDGVTYTTLLTVADTMTFNTPIDARNTTAYRYYRLVFQYAAGTGTYTSVLKEVTLFERLPSIIFELDNQELSGRVKVNPSGGIRVGPNGIEIDAPSADGALVGGVIYAASAPDVSDSSIPYPVWIDTSVEPRQAKVYNAATGTWEILGLADNEGRVISSGTVPDVAATPAYERYIWINQTLSPPSLNIYDAIAEEWLSQCAICDGGGAYPAQLPAPIFTPSSGAIPVNVSMAVSGVSGVSIYYTTDGSDPDDGDTLYSTPVAISTVTTLKAIAIKSGWLDSNITSQLYGTESVDAWLANINFRDTGEPNKSFGAATFDDDYLDVWNNVRKPLASSAGWALVDATGAVVDITVRLSSYVDPTTFTHNTLTHPDTMMSTYIRSVDSFSRDVAWHFEVPLDGVYDIYCYGHGPTDTNDDSIFQAVGDYGQESAEGTASTGSDWATNAWVEGEQYVLFNDIEPLRAAPVGASYEYRVGSVTVLAKWNTDNLRIQGFQIRKKNQLPKVKFSPVGGSSFVGSKNITLYVPEFSTTDILYYTGTAVTVGAMKEIVRVATAAALPANTRTSNTLEADANGDINGTGIDSVTDLIVGDRILVKNEGTGANNGIYEITVVGDGGTPWEMDRVADADADAEVTGGIWVKSDEGTANVGKFWLLTTADPITLNTTALTFSEFTSYASAVAIAATTTFQAVAHMDGIDPSVPVSATFTKV